MLGAVAGDIIGSIYEGYGIKTTDFPLFSAGCTFTDDTVLSAAVADCIMNGGTYRDKLREFYASYPDAGYGGTFQLWAASRNPQPPYNSWGNGSAMRVSPIGFAFDSLDRALQEARKSAEVTHNHPEGIKGAQATASAVFWAQSGKDKNEIKQFIEETFHYDLSDPLDAIRKTYTFDVSCQGSVPQAITAFLESDDVEDAIRNAISLGGDSDTLACIAGGIAHAFYKSVPLRIEKKVYEILDSRLGKIVSEFTARYAAY